MEDILGLVGEVAFELVEFFLFERSSSDSELADDDISSSEQNG